MKKSNIFTNIPNKINQEVFEDIVSNKNIKIERIISHGDITPKGEWYDQDTNEWVMLMQGEAILSFEDDKSSIKLTAGEYINIPAHIKHRVSWTTPNEKTIWLAIHY